MSRELKRLAIEHGDRLTVIPVGRLSDLKKVIEDFSHKEELNRFQEWIVNSLYNYGCGEVGFSVKSIILMAISHPLYASVEVSYQRKINTFLSLVRSDFKGTEEYLREYIEGQGYSIQCADNLPMKRLGTHSGLATYGRNNITYINGIGSNFSYAAYFTDMSCQEDAWGDAKIASICSQCNLCIELCPTGAIRRDRFLIDNQRCLSYLNESPGEFPSWVPKTAHHTLYDCLICQRSCPMNHAQLENIAGPISFSEEETNMLLEGTPIALLSVGFQKKIYLLGMDEWYDAIPRNLKTLLDGAKV